MLRANVGTARLARVRTGLSAVAASAAFFSLAGGAAPGEPRRGDADGIPEGYRLVYETSFEEAAALNDFRFTDPRAWRLGERDGRRALELHGASEYSPPHRSPANIALLSNLELESFVLDADLLQTGREYGHRDMCIFFGFVDPAKYYYAHIASAADEHAHNVFIVNRSPRVKVAGQTTSGVDWGSGKWHRVRVVRDAESGTVEVYFDDLSRPILSASDRTFPKGRVGFGSFDDTGMIDGFRIWAPKAPGRGRADVFAAAPLEPFEGEPDLGAEGFVPLFDGKSLAGWERAGGRASGRMEYAVEDGAIAGTCVPGQPNGFLCSEKTFGNFVFTCEVKIEVPVNSGIQFRSERRRADGRVFGYQCEIDPSERAYSGGIYDEARRGWLFPLWGKAYEKARRAFSVSGWNRFTIQARGRRLQTWVNGVPCADYTDTDPEHFTPRGFIALQVHGGERGRILWRGLRIRELPD